MDRFQRSLEAIAATSPRPLVGSFAIRVAALVQSCGRWERVALLANRATRTDVELSSLEIVDLAQRAAAASERRDKSLSVLFGLLGVDKAAADLWADLDAHPDERTRPQEAAPVKLLEADHEGAGDDGSEPKHEAQAAESITRDSGLADPMEA